MGNENVKLIGRPTIGLQLLESDDDGEFTTMDVLAGLCGVCHTLDEAGGNCDDVNVVHQLSIAAKVLCFILNERVITL
jgi:hypothetical protein